MSMKNTAIYQAMFPVRHKNFTHADICFYLSIIFYLANIAAMYDRAFWSEKTFGVCCVRQTKMSHDDIFCLPGEYRGNARLDFLV